MVRWRYPPHRRAVLTDCHQLPKACCPSSCNGSIHLIVRLFSLTATNCQKHAVPLLAQASQTVWWRCCSAAHRQRSACRCWSACRGRPPTPGGSWPRMRGAWGLWRSGCWTSLMTACPSMSWRPSSRCGCYTLGGPRSQPPPPPPLPEQLGLALSHVLQPPGLLLSGLGC